MDASAPRLVPYATNSDTVTNPPSPAPIPTTIVIDESYTPDVDMDEVTSALTAIPITEHATQHAAAIGMTAPAGSDINGGVIASHMVPSIIDDVLFNMPDGMFNNIKYDYGRVSQRMKDMHVWDDKSFNEELWTQFAYATKEFGGEDAIVVKKCKGDKKIVNRCMGRIASANHRQNTEQFVADVLRHNVGGRYVTAALLEKHMGVVADLRSKAKSHFQCKFKKDSRYGYEQYQHVCCAQNMCFVTVVDTEHNFFPLVECMRRQSEHLAATHPEYKRKLFIRCGKPRMVRVDGKELPIPKCAIIYDHDTNTMHVKAEYSVDGIEVIMPQLLSIDSNGVLTRPALQNKVVGGIISLMRMIQSKPNDRTLSDVSAKVRAYTDCCMYCGKDMCSPVSLAIGAGPTCFEKHGRGIQTSLIDMYESGEIIPQDPMSIYSVFHGVERTPQKEIFADLVDLMPPERKKEITESVVFDGLGGESDPEQALKLIGEIAGLDEDAMRIAVREVVKTHRSGGKYVPTPVTGKPFAYAAKLAEVVGVAHHTFFEYYRDMILYSALPRH